MGHNPEVEACGFPQGQARNLGCDQRWFWGRKLSPSSDGGTRTERRADVDEDDTNVDSAVDPNVNVGLGSKTVAPHSPPRAENLISAWDELGSMSPILRNQPRTEVEIPPSQLALVSSPPPLHFRDMDEGDPIDERGTCPAPRHHVRVLDQSQNPSRYVRSSSRLGVGIPFTPRSHSGFLGTKEAMSVSDGMDARISDRPLGASRNVGFSPTNIHPRMGKPEKQDHRRELPGTAAVGVSANRPCLPPPRSPPSDSEVRTNSPTPGSLSPRTVVLSGSGPSTPVLRDHDTALAFRWSLRQDKLNEMMTGKTVDGCQSNGRLSVVPVDGSEIGE